MKNLYVHIFCILFLATIFQTETFASVAPIEKTEPVAQLQTSASAAAQSAKARLAGEVQFEYNAPEPAKDSPWDFLKLNWGILTLAFVSFLEVGARLTPTEQDNTILKILTTIINAIIPNFRKGGGVF